MTVLSHVQENGVEFARVKGEESWSAGSSYTGITTTANLRKYASTFCPLRRIVDVLGVMEHGPPFVEKHVDAEFDAAFYDPSK